MSTILAWSERMLQSSHLDWKMCAVYRRDDFTTYWFKPSNHNVNFRCSTLAKHMKSIPGKLFPWFPFELWLSQLEQLAFVRNIPAREAALRKQISTTIQFVIIVFGLSYIGSLAITWSHRSLLADIWKSTTDSWEELVEPSSSKTLFFAKRLKFVVTS